MNCSNAAHSHIISGVEAGAPECGTGGGEQPAVLLWHDVRKEIHPNISLPEERRLFDRFYTMGAGRNATGLGGFDRKASGKAHGRTD